jgi:hypothetical protein
MNKKKKDTKSENKTETKTNDSTTLSSEGKRRKTGFFKKKEDQQDTISNMTEDRFDPTKYYYNFEQFLDDVEIREMLVELSKELFIQGFNFL